MEQKIICVAGPSGGVGKSTIAKELAVAFSATKVNDMNIKTCIVDANLIFGTQKSFFSIIPKYTIEDWVVEISEAKQTLNNLEIIERYNYWEQVEKYLFYSEEQRLHVLPAPSKGHYFDISQEDFDIIIYALRKYFDVIIIDTGNNLENVTMAAMRVADNVLIMVTDESRSIDSARRLRAKVREQQIPLGKFQIILNKVPVRFSERLFSKKEIERELLLPVSVSIPYSKDTWKLNNARIPIVTDKKKSKMKKNLLQLAHMLVPEVRSKNF